MNSANFTNLIIILFFDILQIIINDEPHTQNHEIDLHFTAYSHLCWQHISICTFYIFIYCKCLSQFWLPLSDGNKNPHPAAHERCASSWLEFIYEYILSNNVQISNPNPATTHQLHVAQTFAPRCRRTYVGISIIIYIYVSRWIFWEVEIVGICGICVCWYLLIVKCGFMLFVKLLL